MQSANDGCIIIAEGMAGSEENFAKLMTERARAIGLEKSVFKNSTGLPAEGQVVTVRELAMLGLHIWQEYPDLYKYYSQPRVHLEQDHPAEPQPAAGDGHRRRRHEDRLHRGIRLRDRRLGEQRGGRRVFAAMSGMASERERAEEARKLIEWGMQAFEKKRAVRRRRGDRRGLRFWRREGRRGAQGQGPGFDPRADHQPRQD